jgi:hypothetical protein
VYPCKLTLAGDSDAEAVALDGERAGGSPASYVAEVLAVLPGRVDGGGCSGGRSWQGVSSSSLIRLQRIYNF